MAAPLALCVWGQMDGQWIPADQGQFTAGRDLYRFRWWELGGRQVPVYICAAHIEGLAPERHPDTRQRIRDGIQTAATAGGHQ